MRARAVEQLAQLRVVAVLVEQLASAGGVVDRPAPLLGELRRRLELRERAARLRVAVAVGDHVGVRDLARDLGEPRLDLLDELLDHTAEGSGRARAVGGPGRPRSAEDLVAVARDDVRRVGRRHEVRGRHRPLARRDPDVADERLEPAG